MISRVINMLMILLMSLPLDAAIHSKVDSRVLVSPVYDEKEGLDLAIALWRDGYLGEARSEVDKISENDHPAKYYLLARLDVVQNAGARTDEYLQESLKRFNHPRLDEEMRKEILLFAGVRSAERQDQVACETHFRNAAALSSFQPPEARVMGECALAGSDSARSLDFSNWLLTLLPESEELAVLKIQVLLKAKLIQSARRDAILLISNQRLGTESILKVTELWNSTPAVQQEFLEAAALISDAIEIHEALAKILFESGQSSRARQIFEALSLKENRFRHISAEMCRAEGRLRNGLLHTQRILEAEGWLRQEVAIANERRSWSQLASFAKADFADPEVSYAVAYSLARVGDYSLSLKRIENLTGSTRADRLREKLNECQAEAWDCGRRIK